MTTLSVNALNGLISFLLLTLLNTLQKEVLCQCPKRANFISTMTLSNIIM